MSSNNGSSPKRRRVVITGIGPITPIGEGVEDFWNALKEGKNGIAPITVFDPQEKGIDVKIGGEVKNFDITKYYDDPKQARNMNKDMDRVTQFAVAGAKLAVEDAGINFSEMNTDDIGTFVGTGIGGIQTTASDANTLLERGQKRVGVRSIIRLMPNAPSGHIAILHGLKGRAKCDSTACASGLDSIMDAFFYIRNGMADVMVTGGTEACLTDLAIASFSNMTALSKRDCPPEEACCPFDARRDGFIMGEGAAIFVFEELEHAKARGAKIYAEVVGGGASCDSFHITAPSEGGEGSARAIESALKDAGVEDKSVVSYVHAHGTSTPLNDARETAAIKKVFGDHAYKLCVSSTKSMTGHMIGAAGPTGVAAAALACQNDVVPPTMNYKEKDPDCDLDYVANKAQERPVDHALVQSLGFGGHNSVMVLKKFRD